MSLWWLPGLHIGVGDIHCCLGGGQGGHQVCLIVVMVVFVDVFVVVTRPTCWCW